MVYQRLHLDLRLKTIVNNLVNLPLHITPYELRIQFASFGELSVIDNTSCQTAT